MSFYLKFIKLEDHNGVNKIFVLIVEVIVVSHKSDNYRTNRCSSVYRYMTFNSFDISRT